MTLQKRLKNSVTLIISGFLVLIQIISCNNSASKGEIGYGKSYFMDNCYSCHGNYKGFDNAPGILAMYNSDSLILLEELRNIKKDISHKKYFDSKNYSDREVKSILKFIKEYFEPKN